MGMGKRIRLRLEELDRNAKWLAESASTPDHPLSPAALSALIIRDSKRSEFAPQIAAALGVTDLWLTTGKGTKLRMAKPSDLANTGEAPDLAHQVPLISWVSAGAWSEAADPYAPGAAMRWIGVAEKPSQRTFALEVRGDSMAPDFPEGCIIIVNPDRRAKSGDYVVARNPHWDEATFKRYIVDAGVPYLKPLNPAYRQVAVEPGTIIAGVVVEMLMRRKF